MSKKMKFLTSPTGILEYRQTDDPEDGDDHDEPLP